MAQQVKLTARKRTLVGRNAIKKIKGKGLVPGVIYGSQAEPIALQVDGRELTSVLAHASSEHVLVELEIVDGSESTNRLALIQEVQHHPLKRELLHVDFHAVSATEKIISEVPIEAVGEALLFASNATTYAYNFYFQGKMVLMGLAGVNMAIFHLFTGRDVEHWGAAARTPLGAKAAGAVSLALWIGVVAFGRKVGFTLH